MEYWRNWWIGLKKDWSNAGTGVSIKGNNSQVPVINPGNLWEHMFSVTRVGIIRIGRGDESRVRIRSTYYHNNCNVVRLDGTSGIGGSD